MMNTPPTRIFLSPLGYPAESAGTLYLHIAGEGVSSLR